MKKAINFKKYLVFLYAILFGLFIKLFVLDILIVQGNSMAPTIKNKDIIFVNKLAYGIVIPFSDKIICQWAKPKNDHIVTFMYQDKIVLKRCVGKSKDMLEYSRDKGYNLKCNETVIPLTEHQYNLIKNNSIVPENMIFVVGDNYAKSIDSRDYGFIPDNNILGKVIGR